MRWELCVTTCLCALIPPIGAGVLVGAGVSPPGSVLAAMAPPNDSAPGLAQQEQPPPPSGNESPTAKEDPPPKEEAHQPSDPPTAEDILRRMREQRPVNPPIEPSSAREDGTPAATPAGLLPEGERIIQRAGRIIHEGTWWVLVLESDHPGHPEPRLKMLPNQILEQMVRYTEHRPEGAVFIVSGEVTSYLGENFLLARAAPRRVDTGNLRK
jgi:hypothetical protein